MSSLRPLIDALKKSEAEELCVAPGEKIHVLRRGKRHDIGRDVVQLAAINQLAAEVVGVDAMLGAQVTPVTKRVMEDGFDVDITVGPGQAGGIMLTLRAGPTRAPAPVPAGPPLISPSLVPMPDVRPRMTAPPTAPAAFSTVSVASSVIDSLLRDMVLRGASDLHLSAGVVPVMRIHGEIQFLADRPKLGSNDVLAMLKPVMGDRALRDFEEKRDVDFAYSVPSVGRFRVNVFLDSKGVGSVIRHIPSEILPIERLGLPPQALDLCKLTKGLVLVTGPTGSGKSTTMASMLDYMNKNRSDHVITIEDPIEFLHVNDKCLINQREVGAHTLSFKNALRAALREDPDVVLVGELRDLETISIALETAETGHLVIGTLHTTTATSTIDRIIDQFPAESQQQIRVMLADTLKGVISQVLCRKVGGGRVAAMEVLMGNTALTALIREGKTFQIPSIMQTGRQQGMVTMTEALMGLVQRKVISPQEAWMRTSDKPSLSIALKTAGLPSTF